MVPEATMLGSLPSRFSPGLDLSMTILPSMTISPRLIICVSPLIFTVTPRGTSKRVQKSSRRKLSPPEQIIFREVIVKVGEYRLDVCMYSATSIGDDGYTNRNKPNRKDIIGKGRKEGRKENHLFLNRASLISLLRMNKRNETTFPLHTVNNDESILSGLSNIFRKYFFRDINNNTFD